MLMLLLNLNDKSNTILITYANRIDKFNAPCGATYIMIRAIRVFLSNKLSHPMQAIL